MKTQDRLYSQKVFNSEPKEFTEQVRVYMLKYIVEKDDEPGIIEYEEKLRPQYIPNPEKDKDGTKDLGRPGLPI